MPETSHPDDHKSTNSVSNTCVEVARVGDCYLIRDAKHPEIAPLVFTKEEWDSFVAGVIAGEFRF